MVRPLDGPETWANTLANLINKHMQEYIIFKNPNKKITIKASSDTEALKIALVCFGVYVMKVGDNQDLTK